MIIGRIGKLNLTGTGAVKLGAAMADNMVVNIRMTNRNAFSVKVRIAISDAASGTPQDEDWIEYDQAVDGNGILEDTGLALSIGEQIWVGTDQPGVTARAHGIPTI